MPNQLRKQPKRARKIPGKLAGFQLTSKIDIQEVQTKVNKLGKDKGKRSYSDRQDTHTLFSSPKRKAIETNSNQNLSKLKKVLANVGIDNMKVEEYIPSSIDLPDSVTVKTVDLLKEMGGRGLFAAQDIEEGTCIGIYTGEEYASRADFDRYLEENPMADDSYAMRIGRRMIDAANKGNFTRYINFSDSQDNVEFVEGVVNGEKVVKVIALNKIYQGQQFLVNYNTYDEKASKLYYFLNSSDGSQSASEVYEQNKANYSVHSKSGDCEAFQIKDEAQLLISRVAAAVFANKPLSNLNDVKLSEIDLPILRMGPFKRILDFKEADTFTPLMVACYLGQLNNVNWLIKQGANVDQQQNRSGNCPLFFALLGYNSGQTTKNKYLQIILSLIASGAILGVHDRADRTFLHKAIDTLSDRDFKKVVGGIKNQDETEFEELYHYVDENDLDLVQYALKAKEWNKVQHLLEAYPDYFSLYTGKGKSGNAIEIKTFKTAIEDYDSDDLDVLLGILGEEGLNLHEDLLEALGVVFDNTISCSY